jgi:hypothetical protein
VIQERYFRCDGLLRRWALLEEENSRVGEGHLSAEEALEARHVAEQALTEVREILDGEARLGHFSDRAALRL